MIDLLAIVAMCLRNLLILSIFARGAVQNAFEDTTQRLRGSSVVVQSVERIIETALINLAGISFNTERELSSLPSMKPHLPIYVGMSFLCK